MKSIYYFSVFLLSLLLSMSSCSDKDDVALVVKFTVEDKTYYVGDEVSFHNESYGGSGEYSFLWDFGNGEESELENPTISYDTNGSYAVKLTITDSKGKSGFSQKVVVVEPAPIPSVGDLTLKWISSTPLNEIRSISPVVSDDNFVYMTSEDHILRKYDTSNGIELWNFDLRNTADGVKPEGRTLSSPSIDPYTETIYVGTGESGGKVGRVYAINPDGSKKWVISDDAETGFWNKGNPSTPRINYIMCPADEKYVYMGNGGGTGSVISVDKVTGERHGYVSNASNTGGPAGGVSGGLILTKDNTLMWAGQNNGFFAVSTSSLSVGGNVTWQWNNYNSTPNKTSEYPNGSPAISDEGVIYVGATFSPNDNRIIAFDSEGTTIWESQLGEIGKLDQGGIVIGEDGTVFASLKRSEGESNGGIVALNPTDGKIKWRYGIPEDVSGTAAIDQAGNIHFGTQSGNYYVIKPEDSNAVLIVKHDIAELISDSGRSDWEAGSGRIWSSPTIDDEGVIYIGITNTLDFENSALVALTDPGITGIANSAWPMRGQNRKHTNTQR